MPAYIVAEHDVRDQQTYDRAIPIARDAIAAFEGRYLSSSTSAELIEGNGRPSELPFSSFRTLRPRSAGMTEQYREARHSPIGCNVADHPGRWRINESHNT